MSDSLAVPVCLVSACLCGIACRYDGASSPVPELVKLYGNGLALAVCPETAGGLPTPRVPCERRGERVVTRDGVDVTSHFLAGAVYALDMARRHAIRIAVLKENSPSCGSNMVYDGTFSGRRISGQGITAALLREDGIRVLTEHSFKEFLPGMLERTAQGFPAGNNPFGENPAKKFTPKAISLGICPVGKISASTLHRHFLLC